MKTPIARRWLPALLGLFLTLFIAVPAFAGGRLEWKSKTLKERDDKSWKLEVSIYMAKAPDVAHVPMKFEFMPTVYFERDMMDGDKLVERKVPLENRQALIESVDVGFLDSGSGKIESRTRFSFKLTRGNGYEAGEYKVTVRDTRNGQLIGTATTLIFAGENEIIDRRAMVFTGDKKKPKKGDPNAETPKDKGTPDAETPNGTEPAAEAAPESPPAEEAAAPAPGAEDDKATAEDEDPDGEIKEKPGGCGCRVQDSGHGGGAALLFALALGGALSLRRRHA